MRKPHRLEAGRLRRRITIQKPALHQADDGSMTTTWITVAADVPAAIEPLSVNAFVAAQSVKSKIAARILIRYRAGLAANMRIIADDGTLYAPEGWLPDDESGREYLTAPCKVLPC